MRIHSDLIEREHLKSAVAGLDGVNVRIDIRRASRKRDHSWDVALVAEPRPGRRRRNTGRYGLGDDYAATWDEWGVFLSWLFSYDPDAVCGDYDDKEHFHWSTGGRFRNVVALDMHDQHRWIDDGDSLNGRFHVETCKCGAVRNSLGHFQTWAEFQAGTSAL